MSGINFNVHWPATRRRAVRQHAHPNPGWGGLHGQPLRSLLQQMLRVSITTQLQAPVQQSQRFIPYPSGSVSSQAGPTHLLRTQPHCTSLPPTQLGTPFSPLSAKHGFCQEPNTTPHH